MFLLVEGGCECMFAVYFNYCHVNIIDVYSIVTVQIETQKLHLCQPVTDSGSYSSSALSEWASP